MIQTDVTMRMEHFHDFYFLQALNAGIMREISANPEIAFKRSVEKLQLDTQDAMDEISPNIALRTFVYLYAACLGEARHARETSAERRFISETVKHHRHEIFAKISEFRPTPENLKALIMVFDQSWTSGFGGRAWKAIAEALPSFFNMPPSAFIDHVIDLEHNNGTAFNKADAKSTIFFSTEYPDHFRSFLDYKFEKDILRQASETTLRVSRKVFSLIQRFATIFHIKPITWVEPGLSKLDEYQVTWEDKKLNLVEKWYEWVDVTTGNVPTAEKLFYITELSEITTTRHTAQEIKAIVKEKKELAKAVSGTFWKPYLIRGTNKKFKEWLEWATKNCKVPQIKNPYTVLPFTFTLDVSKIHFTFPVPYAGIGQKGDGCFKLSVLNYWIPPHQYPEPVQGYATLDGHAIKLHLNNQTIIIANKEMEALLD
jgi:hypothetical protein